MNDKQMMNQAKEKSSVAAQARALRRATPLVDIYETADDLVLLIDLPGVAEQDLQIEVSQGVLTLEGAVADPQARTEKHYYRQFKLHDRIDADAGEAQLRDGVLTLKLPKLAEAKPKKIAVKTLH